MEVEENPEPYNNRVVYERLVAGLNIHEQFAEVVMEYSSHYNRSTSVLYSPENLKGKPSKYPNGGDHPWTYMLRSYGKWMSESESAQRQYMLPDKTSVESEDFAVLRFEVPVIPKKVTIYETYNPGAIVKLFGRLSSGRWYLLWKIKAAEFSKVEQTVRIFSPKIKELPILVNEIRLEFNQSLLNYHTAIDAVLLAGYAPTSRIVHAILEKDLVQEIVRVPTQRTVEIDQSKDYINLLPNEVLLQIFQYCDLQTHCRCAQVCVRWKYITNSISLYSEVSLKRYWYKIDNTVLQYLTSKFGVIKKLDLSWCGFNDMRFSTDLFINFMNESCSPRLTHLSLNFCDFLTENILTHIANFREITDLRLQNFKSVTQSFLELTHLTKLTALDVSSTTIGDLELQKILKCNPNLKHLIVDNCYNLNLLDNLTYTLANYNKELVSFSAWQNPTLTTVGVANLALCHNLRELDFGWCLMVSEAGNGLELIAINCPNLRKLVIAGWRAMSDEFLRPVVYKCKNLEYLDILGIRNITDDLGNLALKYLPKLRLFDISFCEQISSEQVKWWKRQYPNVQIKRSCESHRLCD